MGKYFGTDGFRGEAGITLTADHAYIVKLEGKRRRQMPKLQKKQKRQKQSPF